MSARSQKLSARDYKNTGRRDSSFDPAQYQQLGIGLVLGLAVALGVWLYDHRAQPQAADAAPERAPKSRVAATDAAEAPAEEEDPAKDFTFYETLPKFEVVVPEKDHDARRDLPSEPVVQPGNYILQVGSYRNRPDAEQLRDKLGKQGIDASIQDVTVDTDAWHRVRIGPVSDLNRLNAIRKQLRAADIDAIIYRVGD